MAVTMSSEEKYRFMRRSEGFKRLGFALIALSLVFFMIVTYLPELRSGPIVVYSYSLLGAGLIALVLHQGFKIIHYRRWKETPVRCLDCGWSGLGAEWFRHHCCPDCDSIRVAPFVN